MEIIKKPKNDLEIDILLKEISKSNNIICYSKKELIHFIEKENAFFAYEDSQLIGMGMIKTINNEWIELSTLIVLEKFRGQHYGKEIFENLFSQIKDKKIVSYSRNPITQKWLEEKGFKSVKLLSLPKPILIHGIREKVKLFKIKDLLLKGLKGNWKYYILK